ncbi:MAG: biopolymer transporter ExbD [Bacteroidetes bacterium]|nr:biopolymer transporter ExbD [Bacteroidota bacterium]
MADIQTPEKGSHSKHGKGKVRSKKMSTRVDFTPMVDLAFLLISFFMLTTTLNKPVAMELNMPKKDEQVQTDVKESQVINLLLDKDDKIWYYEGQVVYDMKTTNYAADGVREVLYDKQKDVGRKHGNPEKMIVIIKMTEGASYKNMVDILDEMDITNTKIYAIQDIADLEVEAIANGGKLDIVPTPQ